MRLRRIVEIIYHISVEMFFYGIVILIVVYQMVRMITMITKIGWDRFMQLTKNF